jgi:hypothetical protein
MGIPVAWAQHIGIDKEKILKAILSELLKIAVSCKAPTPQEETTETLSNMSDVELINYGQTVNEDHEFWLSLPQNQDTEFLKKVLDTTVALCL